MRMDSLQTAHPEVKGRDAIPYPGSININVEGAYIVNDKDEVSPSPSSSSSSSGSGPESPKEIALPHHTQEVSHIAVDIGGTLAKVVFFTRNDKWERGRALGDSLIEKSDELPGGRLNFTSFETSKIDDCIAFMKKLLLKHHKRIDRNGHQRDPQHAEMVVMATGGGAYKFYDRMRAELGVEIYQEEEMRCLIVGLDFFINEIPEEVFTYSADDFPTMQFTDSSHAVYPYMLVNIGSGVSMIKVDGPNQFTRIGGSSLGGGTLWGLLSLLTDSRSFDDMLSMAESGDNTAVDMLVGDIYGRDYTSIGLKSTWIASSFGKVFKADPAPTAERPSEERRKKFKQEDIARSLLYAVSNNIGQIAYLQAQRYGLNTIYFGGSFIRGHAQTMNTLSFAIGFWSKGDMKAYFLRHEGYLGAVGAFLRRQPQGWGRPLQSCSSSNIRATSYTTNMSSSSKTQQKKNVKPEQGPVDNSLHMQPQNNQELYYPSTQSNAYMPFESSSMISRIQSENSMPILPHPQMPNMNPQQTPSATGVLQGNSNSMDAGNLSAVSHSVGDTSSGAMSASAGGNSNAGAPGNAFAASTVSGGSSSRPIVTPRVRKARVKWSEQETNDLLRGCTVHGVGNWKKILVDPELRFNNRSAVDLKDRFRTYFPDEYRRLYPNASTHIDGQQKPRTHHGFVKLNRKERHAFTAEEDALLLQGFLTHGAHWSKIQKDPNLNLGHRRGTDLRDRFRIAFPERYTAAGFKPKVHSVRTIEHRTPPILQNEDYSPNASANSFGWNMAETRNDVAHSHMATNLNSLPKRTQTQSMHNSTAQPYLMTQGMDQLDVTGLDGSHPMPDGSRNNANTAHLSADASVAAAVATAAAALPTDNQTRSNNREDMRAGNDNNANNSSAPFLPLSEDHIHIDPSLDHNYSLIKKPSYF
ncbi:hypothetical protein CANCADRAFT_1308 [Tortispora caseinolytica NRRL Y-17796]|uniref:Uncharacterized protein n=1 Tax=Tortispora caseinolytica NRRL Y-17796 TaxID=767744 RepID=A0A1E4TLT4_9ASCO|nr:hypothetical protein CANCADRAFT_1308 [Tortispora caseinolytica NRRL Y-17796]